MATVSEQPFVSDRIRGLLKKMCPKGDYGTVTYSVFAPAYLKEFGVKPSDGYFHRVRREMVEEGLNDQAIINEINRNNQQRRKSTIPPITDEERRDAQAALDEDDRDREEARKAKIKEDFGNLPPPPVNHTIPQPPPAATTPQPSVVVTDEVHHGSDKDFVVPPGYSGGPVIDPEQKEELSLPVFKTAPADRTGRTVDLADVPNLIVKARELVAFLGGKETAKKLIDIV